MAASDKKAMETLKASLEQAQVRLASFEDEAQRVFAELMEKGRATRKEVAGLLAKVSAPELLDVKGLSGRARDVGDDMTRRIEEVRLRMIALAGVASREQVDGLTKELAKLSRKLDRLAAAKGPAARPPAAKSAPAKRRGGRPKAG